ncbi:MAG: hypothetical protein ABIO92_07420 [Chloroflexia bacterium]
MYVAERNEYVERQEAGFLFWLMFIAATTLGAFVGHYLEDLIRIVQLPGAFDILSIAAGGAVAGAVIGLAQALVLMPYLKRQGALEWLVASILGRIASGIIFFLYGDALSGLFFDNSYGTVCGLILLKLLLGGVLGFILAFPQYLVLRHRSTKAVFWVIANIGVSVITTYIPFLTVGVFYGLLTGVITGYVMVDILRQPTRLAEWRVREEL